MGVREGGSRSYRQSNERFHKLRKKMINSKHRLLPLPPKMKQDFIRSWYFRQILNKKLSLYH